MFTIFCASSQNTSNFWNEEKCLFFVCVCVCVCVLSLMMTRKVYFTSLLCSFFNDSKINISLISLFFNISSFIFQISNSKFVIFKKKVQLANLPNCAPNLHQPIFFSWLTFQCMHWYVPVYTGVPFTRLYARILKYRPAEENQLIQIRHNLLDLLIVKQNCLKVQWFEKKKNLLHIFVELNLF